MAKRDLALPRTWQMIAEELSREMDTAKLQKLAEELERVLQEREKPASH
jgi:hypothetical protein